MVMPAASQAWNRQSLRPRKAPGSARTTTPSAKTSSRPERSETGPISQSLPVLSTTIFRVPESMAFWRQAVASFGSNPQREAFSAIASDRNTEHKKIQIYFILSLLDQ